MAKLRSYYQIVRILAFTIGTLLCMVKGEVCSEQLGTCAGDAQCDSRCNSAHRGGKGSCEGTGACMCFYDCETPIPKICNSGIGLCSVKCNDECCNQNCATKYAGLEGHGICYNPVGPYNYCLCLYNC